MDGIRSFLFDLALSPGLASAIIRGQVQSMGGCGQVPLAPGRRLRQDEIKLPMAQYMHKYTRARRSNDEIRALPCNLRPYIGGWSLGKT
jgi:hypothetical protein